MRASRLVQAQVDPLLWAGAMAHGYGRAIQDARALADELYTRGEYASAAHVLHDAVRLGDDAAAPRVVTLAASCDGPRLEACAMHAAALARSDGPALAAAAAASRRPTSASTPPRPGPTQRRRSVASAIATPHDEQRPRRR